MNDPTDTGRKGAARFLRDPAWAAAAFAVVAVALGARAWLSFRNELPAGMDAAYYPVQARALLEHGRLQWTDVPLVFALDAMLARAAMTFTGWDLDQALVWASRVIDIACEPFAAIAVFAVAWRSARGARSAIPAAVACGTMATLAPSLLRMVGDFEKQSLAMVFMAASWTALAGVLGAADARGVRRGAAWTAGFLALTALSHAGTFAAAMLGVAVAAAFWAAAGGVRRAQALRVAAGAARGRPILLGGVWLIAPRKATALLEAPAKLFAADHRPMGFGPPMDFEPPMEFDRRAEPDGAARRGGPPMMGPPPGAREGLPPLAWGACVVGGLLVLSATARRSRAAAADDAGRAIARSNACTAAGAGVVAAFLSCPFLNHEYAMRLTLMAPVALALFLAYVLAVRRSWPQVPKARLRLAIDWGAAAIAAAALAWSWTGETRRGPGPGGPAMPGPGGIQLITPGGYAELRSWRDELAARGSAVVAARHGLEFWASLALHCEARQSRLLDADFGRYERLYVLQERRGPGRPGMGHGRGPGGGPGMGGPMAPVEVPEDARVVKEGEWYVLLEVPRSARPRDEHAVRDDG